MPESFTLVYIFQKVHPDIEKLLDALNSYETFSVVKTTGEGPTPFAFHVSKTPALIMYDKDNRKNLKSYRALNVINVTNSENMDKLADFFLKFDEYLIKQQFYHSDYVDYIIDIGLEYEIIDFHYNCGWTIKRIS